MVIGGGNEDAVPKGVDDDSSESSDLNKEKNIDEDKETQDRILSAMAMEKVMMNDPFKNALGTGPRRFLGVVKPVILYQQMCLWCQELHHKPTPSFTTFCRALKAARPWLRFRKSAGQHGLCDQCCWFKKKLRARVTSEERVQVMDKYAHHLLQVWKDRQMEANLHAQACHTRKAIQEGSHSSTLANSVSCLQNMFALKMVKQQIQLPSSTDHLQLTSSTFLLTWQY